MSSVFFVSDLHLGHRKILYHTARVPGAYRGGTTTEEHDEWVIEQCLSVGPNKHTVWYLMGDIAMEKERLTLLDRLPGRKILIMGNHDTFATIPYLVYVERVAAIIQKYGMWITHAPIHEVELRGKPNLHGHMHHNDLQDDPRYFNACIEWLPDHRPISLDELREIWLNYVIEEMREQHDEKEKDFWQGYALGMPPV